MKCRAARAFDTVHRPQGLHLAIRAQQLRERLCVFVVDGERDV